MGKPIEERLPEELEQFRMGSREEKSAIKMEDTFTQSEFDQIEAKAMPSYNPLKKEPVPEEETKRMPGTLDNKIELILSKLDTVDARLRFIEEKLQKRERSYL